ncbi:Artemisinic aldehyde Delta(11(13)) reductase [Mycena venus]|uniref:Artemisinic aldehyde Delta(11(13)) reductase n=1 Tax=Mycena venus TaxID=2733690 RepID=A0A8H6XIH6_9AGAR|nr:Artemisinic aldehyde Delta(11(13)) reductase [Mycena venus]
MSTLFTPLKLGSTTIPNRIGMSALTRSRSSATVPNEIMLKYYVQRAKGGAGLIVTEGVLITRQGTEWPQAPGLWEKAQIDGWKKITDAVHEAGSKIYAQLWHVGRVAHPNAPEQIAAGVPVYAPSALSARGGKFRFISGEPGYVTPTEIADPTVLIAQFKQAAINAKEAGFDGVELHGANGYVVHQFLDSTSNHRTDKWGGSPENRTRFALEILKEFVEVYGPNVALKVSPAGGYNDMGMPLQDTIDTFGHLLREADKLGLSYVALARYNPYLDMEFDGKKARHAARRRRDVHALPEKDRRAEELVGSGKAAGVFFGMNWLTHPDLARRIKDGKKLDNAPDYMHLYGAEGVDPALGYTDYKEAA